MALLHPKSLDTVVAIGISNNNGQKHWVGTGFLYGLLNRKKDDGTNEYKVYLVTNKHVLEGHSSILLKFNPTKDQPSLDFPAQLLDSDGSKKWFGHPTPSVDVAILSIDINTISKYGARSEFIASDIHSLTSTEMSNSEITEGDGIFALGFPMGILDSDRQYVIVRQGCIARVRDLYENRKSDFLCDVMVFPGNSGGPVYIKPELTSINNTKPNHKSCLIGLVKSYIPYRDSAVSQQTKRTRIIFEENSGLTAVEPVEHINQTIKLYQEHWKNKNKV